MKSAKQIVISTFGTLAGLMGIEHGIGEVLQGNITPVGLVILSWPDSEFFRIMNGEPAMTIIPNILISGILTILISLIFLMWVIFFIKRKNGGFVLILLSIIMLLVGGGFGPPILGIIIGVFGTTINSRFSWLRRNLSDSLQHFIGNLWFWFFMTCLIAWLFLFPGIPILNYFFPDKFLESVLGFVILSAFSSLLITFFTGIVYDIRKQTE